MYIHVCCGSTNTTKLLAHASVNSMEWIGKVKARKHMGWNKDSLIIEIQYNNNNNSNKYFVIKKKITKRNKT